MLTLRKSVVGAVAVLLVSGVALAQTRTRACGAARRRLPADDDSVAL